MSSATGSVRPDAMLIDGLPSDSLSVMDRGLHYGDGLFETIACVKGRPRFLSLHLDRLEVSCERLRIAAVDRVALREEISQLAREANEAMIKVIVTRGMAQGRGYMPRGDERTTRVLLRYPGPLNAPAESARVGIASTRLGESPQLAGMKHLNRLEQVLAQVEKAERNLDEILMFSSGGALICGSMSNLFLVREGVLRTPCVDRCGVAGVMRRVVLREARKAGLSTEECTLNAADLETAQEIFLTNARFGIWPVQSIEERTLEPPILSRRLQTMLAPILEEPEDG